MGEPVGSFIAIAEYGRIDMRWMWIDQIIECEKGRRLVAIKNVSLAEEHLHDHFPEQRHPATGETLALFPIMPASLLIEGMAQTAGILVGYTNEFREKVILAKISRAIFHRDVFPGQTIRFDAALERMDAVGALTTGVVRGCDHRQGQWFDVAEIELMFSHIDQNMSGVRFPEENFVLTSNLKYLLREANLID